VSAALPSVVVVGAAGGIGREILRQLAGRARVIAVVESAAQAQQLAALDAQPIACDLADADSVAACLASIRERVPKPLDAFLCCAALQPVGVVEGMERAALERLFAVNVFGALQLLQGLLPALRRARGRVVLFSSMAGRVAIPLLGAYASSKFALEALADALRRELRASGVRVSLIEPGGVATPMAAAQRELVPRALAALGEEPQQCYGDLYRGYLAMTEAALRSACSPSAVAALAVRAALDGARPPARIVCGRDARLLVALGRWLPTPWLDALLVRMVGGARR
jgi:NAD(P)-dependent dehydrogenase (short-subunit alcohol dehydrogenase family)